MQYGAAHSQPRDRLDRAAYLPAHIIAGRDASERQPMAGQTRAACPGGATAKQSMMGGRDASSPPASEPTDRFMADLPALCVDTRSYGMA